MTVRRRTTRPLTTRLFTTAVAAALAAAPAALSPAPALAAPAESVVARCAPGLPVQHPGCGRTYPGADAGNGTFELRGADRYATAVAVARHGFPEADVAVLASGEDAHLVDALSAGPLARRLAAPLLLTARDALPAATAEHLRAQRPAAVLVVGDGAAVSEAVLAQLREIGVASVGRVGGADRYATSRALAALQPGATRAWVASGYPGHLVDALAAGGTAARLGEPLVLVPGTGDATATAAALRSAGVTATTVVGDTAAVSEQVAGQFPAPARVAGPDRWRTALAVAEEGVRRGLPRTDLVVTGGEQRSLVDALAAGPLGRVTLLTGPRGVGEDLVRRWEAAGTDRSAFVGAAAARLVCWGAADAADCAHVATVDVDGDGDLDDVALTGAGPTRQVRVRVEGEAVTLPVPSGTTGSSGAWVGAHPIDDRPGAELVVLVDVGAHAERNAVLTWRAGRLEEQAAPGGADGWYVDASAALNQSITCAAPGEIAVRSTDRDPDDPAGDLLVGTTVWYRSVDGAWEASGATSTERLRAPAPAEYSGWSCAGLPRFAPS